MRQLLPAALIVLASAPVAAGVTEVVGSTIDTLGYDSATIIVHLGAITATGTATLRAAQGNMADGSDRANLAGSAVAANDTHSNKAIALEIHRLEERYLTPVLARAVANSVVNLIEVILYGASQEPVTQTYIVAGKYGVNGLVSPQEGAA